MRGVTVVTAVYGEGHVPFMGALLNSLWEAQVSRVVLVHAELSSVARKELLDTYPNTEPIDARGNFSSIRATRVARKLLAWREGSRAVPDGQALVFLDADTLVNSMWQGEGSALEAPFATAFDVALTVRRGPWMYNSGVVYFRLSAPVRDFLDTWCDLTEWALLHEELGRGKWGAADQASLVMAKALFVGKEPLSFVHLPGSVYNCEDCVPLLPRVAIFHFKGCLPLLLGQRPYGPEYGDSRVPAACEPSFNLWRSAHAAFRRRAAYGLGG